LHAATLTAPSLRAGLDRESAREVVPLLRRLLGAEGAVLGGRDGILAADRIECAHLLVLDAAVREAAQTGAVSRLPSRGVVVVPIRVQEAPAAALGAIGRHGSGALLRLMTEVAAMLAAQLELAELDRARRRAEQAELRFLEAQISPHFLYNTLGAAASFVSSDPGRAGEMLLSLADFLRYHAAGDGELVSLAEELRLVDAYLDLERARFGPRLAVDLHVAPGALGALLPALSVQPIVENAVRHGLEPAASGLLSITIAEQDGEAWVCVEDDGVGSEQLLMLDPPHSHERDRHHGVGLRNVDERLRATFGPDHGLRIETGPGRGTRVTIHVPVAAR
ncbi:MAG TPA: histidine kinase, partial [Acidimicrobiales bacterium]|nr:histidine kinase [Acidimicrobiales bacterium]